MKRFIYALLFFVLLLGACQKEPVLHHNQSSGNKPLLATTKIPSEQEVIEEYKKATAKAWWFWISPMPLDYRSEIEANGHKYYKVTKFRNLKALRDDLLTVFASELTNKFLSSPTYTEIDGVLYGNGAERGSSIAAGDEQYTVRIINDTHIALSVKVEQLNTDSVNGEDDPDFSVIGYETYNFDYQLINDSWVFTNFHTIR
jgi:hypothetical protein